jgi:hypothetical protein
MSSGILKIVRGAIDFICLMISIAIPLRIKPVGVIGDIIGDAYVT